MIYLIKKKIIKRLNDKRASIRELKQKFQIPPIPNIYWWVIEVIKT